MTEAEAKRIISNIKLRHQEYEEHDLFEVEAMGYLEAIEKAKILEEAMDRISNFGLDPSLGQIVGSEHYEKAWLDCWEKASKALEEYRKVK